MHGTGLIGAVDVELAALTLTEEAGAAAEHQPAAAQWLPCEPDSWRKVRFAGRELQSVIVIGDSHACGNIAGQ